jgi:hypothetical protein
MKKKSTKKNKAAPGGFIFVDPVYYGGKKTAQYFKDLAKEKAYVASQLHFEITGSKRQGDIRLHVFDKQSGDRLDTKKFANYFQLTEIEINHLLSRDVQKLGLDRYFQFFQKNKNFYELVDTRDLDILKKYGAVFYNGSHISVSTLLKKIAIYEDRIEREFYKFMLNIQVDGNAAYIELTNEIINVSKQSTIDSHGYTDEEGNFILFKT